MATTRTRVRSLAECSEWSLLAQRPTNPALMEPQKAPEMDYAAVADPLPLPAGMTMGASGERCFRFQRPSLRSEPGSSGAGRVRRERKISCARSAKDFAARTACASIATATSG